jgi:GAF domain-containing protein
MKAPLRGVLGALFGRRARWSAQEDETVRMLREQRAASLAATRRLRRIDVAEVIAESRPEREPWNRI